LVRCLNLDKANVKKESLYICADCGRIEQRFSIVFHIADNEPIEEEHRTERDVNFDKIDKSHNFQFFDHKYRTKL